MQELFLVGRKMSNVLFNLAQDERFAEYSEMMKGLQREWDAAQRSVQRTAEAFVPCAVCGGLKHNHDNGDHEYQARR